MANITFALFFGNRGFFPGDLISGAINEMKAAVKSVGCEYICMDVGETKYGAVETIAEGKKYAEFLRTNHGKYQGVILCMPNFSDENGAVVALKEVDVPVLVQAYPDELGKMDFEHRRDAMCGKFAMCNVLRQYKIPYTLTVDFVVHPSTESFRRDLEKFASVCRVVNGMKSFNIGAIGARTTAFKTVRADESALCAKGINTETFDLSEIFMRMDKITDERVEKKAEQYLEITDFGNWHREKLLRIAKCGAVIDDIIEEYDLHAVAIRCWSEFQLKEGFAPCLVLCNLNERGISASCEVDITNVIMMRALSLASDSPCTLLDYNNNYGSETDKAIMFHCGPVPISMMTGKGKTEEHLMFKKSFGAGSGVGINKGEIRSGRITFGSLKTENGQLQAFVGDGSFTDDSFDSSFFGCGKVVASKTLNEIINYMAENGYKHHLGITFGECKEALDEAFNKYLKIALKVF